MDNLKLRNGNQFTDSVPESFFDDGDSSLLGEEAEVSEVLLESVLELEVEDLGESDDSDSFCCCCAYPEERYSVE